MSDPGGPGPTSAKQAVESLRPTTDRRPLRPYGRRNCLIRNLTLGLLAAGLATHAAPTLPGDPLDSKRAELERQVTELDAAQTACEEQRKALDTRRAELWNRIAGRARGVAFAKDEEYQRLETALNDLLRQETEVRNQSRKPDKGKDEDLKQCLRLEGHRLRLEREAAETAFRRRARELAIRAKPELAADYEALAALDADRGRLLGDWGQRRVERYQAWRRLQGLVPKPVGPSAKMKESVLEVPTPPDAEARRERFAQRNSPENLRGLALRLGRYLDLARPDVAPVREHLQRGEYAAALVAYKRLFVAKMRDLPGHGVPAAAFRDWMLQRHEPDQGWLDDAMRGIFRQNYRGEMLKVNVGPPGCMQWCHVDDRYLGWSLENKLVAFYRGFGRPFSGETGLRLLLDGYLTTGKPEYLHQWCAAIDDWTLNWQSDLARCPENIRYYDAIATRDLTMLLGKLHVASSLRPDFEQVLSATTLVRVLLRAQEEYNPAVVQVKRSTTFNWTAMGLDHLFRNALVLGEWLPSQWALTEARKLAEREWRLTIARDGGVREFSDEGHQGVWAWAYANMFEMLEQAKPAWFNAEYEREFRDLYERNLRFMVRHLKPDGRRHNDDYRAFPDIFFSKTPWSEGPHSIELQSPHLLHEREIAAVLKQVYGDRTDLPEVVRKAGPPTHLDDAMPYLATFYQRRSWGPKDLFLYLRAARINSNPDEDLGGAKIWGFGQLLMEAPPIYVDGVSQNSHHGLPENPGGKTSFLVYDDGQPGDGLWHSSEHFSLAESIYRGAYEETGNRVHWSVFKSGGFGMPLPGVGEPAITDVTEHSRRVFFLRPQGVWLVVDRMASEGAHAYEQNYEIYTPVDAYDWHNRENAPIANADQRVIFDAAAGTIRSDNPGFPNVSIVQAASAPINYRFRQGRGIAMRATDDEFGVRYRGYVAIPRSGVYTFHAPHEFVYPDIECGYDLRLFIDGEEWYPGTRRHGFGDWSVPLVRGLHRFQCIFVDMRPKDGKVETWRDFPSPQALWKGRTPELTVSGPKLERQPLPSSWFMHVPQADWVDTAHYAAAQARGEADAARRAAIARGLAEGLLARWDFAAAEDGRIRDVSGNGHDGGLLGGEVRDGRLVLGGRGHGMALDKELPIFNVDRNFTVAFHFRPKPGSGGLLLRKSRQWGRDGMGLLWQGRWQYFNQQAGSTDINSRVPPPAERQWLTAVYRTDGRSLRVYRDGELVTHGEIKAPPVPNEVPLVIGADLEAEFFDTRIYDRALGREEVRALGVYKAQSRDK